MLQEERGCGLTTYKKLIHGDIVAVEAAGVSRVRKSRDELKTECSKLLLKKICMFTFERLWGRKLTYTILDEHVQAPGRPFLMFLDYLGIASRAEEAVHSH